MIKKRIFVYLAIFVFVIGLMVLSSAEFNKVNAKKSGLSQISQKQSLKIDTNFLGEKAFYLKAAEGINLTKLVNKEDIRTKIKDKLAVDLMRGEMMALQKIGLQKKMDLT